MATESTNTVLTWRVHPVRQHRVAACLALAVIVLLAFLCGQLMESLWWGLFSGAALLLAQSRFFWPSDFRIDEKGVRSRSLLKTTQLPWPEIRCLLHDDRGAYLSRRVRRSFLDAWQGVHLLFADNRNAVVARLQQSINTVNTQGDRR